MPSELFKPGTKKPNIFGTGEKLPFTNNTFDFITTYSVVPYVKNIDQFFEDFFFPFSW